MKNIGTNLHLNRGIWVKSDRSQIICKQSLFPKNYHDDIENFIKDNINESINSNVKAKMTDWKLNDNDILNPIKEWIFNIINVEYSKFLHHHYNFCLENIWGIVYEVGDCTQVHDHLPYFLSFCYYIKCDNNSSPIIFSASGKKIQAKIGRLVVFPSHLSHYVPKQKVNQRICLSGNINVDFK
jgi:hypothetical protein